MPRDSAKAINWYKRAANQGIAESQYILGVVYAEGLGAPEDYVLAHMWFSLAAAQGIKRAAKNRDIAAEGMTPAAISKAQKMARKWKPKK